MAEISEKQSTPCGASGIPIYRIALAKEKCARGNRVRLSDPREIANWFRVNYGCKPQEYFLALYFDVKMTLLGAQEVSVGSLSSAQVDPKVLFAGALSIGAPVMILAHNHPSGDPTPSEQDIQLTQLLAQGAKVLGVNLLDHIVITGGGEYRSFVDLGLIKRG